jgi:hypothetical protein
MEEIENMIQLWSYDLNFYNIAGSYPVLFISAEKLTTFLVIADNVTNHATFLKIKDIDHAQNVIEFNSIEL